MYVLSMSYGQRSVRTLWTTWKSLLALCELKIACSSLVLWLCQCNRDTSGLSTALVYCAGSQLKAIVRSLIISRTLSKLGCLHSVGNR